MNLILTLLGWWCLILIVNAANSSRCNDIKMAMEDFMIVPQCIKTAPKDKLSMIFDAGEVECGNEFHPFETFTAPYLYFKCNRKDMYTFVEFDPDIPFLYKPYFGQLLQNMIVNIVDCNFFKGDRLSVYIGSMPYPGAGAHRRVSLIYKQSSPTNITVELRKRVISSFTNFSVEGFAKEHRLGDPIAGNFYISTLSDCEPETKKCENKSPDTENTANR